MICTYQEDATDVKGMTWPHWKWDEDAGNQAPEWHDLWRSHPKNMDVNYPVEVLVLLHPNVMKARLLHVIAWPAALWRHEVFGQLAVQGLITCAWRNLAVRGFALH